MSNTASSLLINMGLLRVLCVLCIQLLHISICCVMPTARSADVKICLCNSTTGVNGLKIVYQLSKEIILMMIQK